jgi:hypothetical protein
MESVVSLATELQEAGLNLTLKREQVTLETSVMGCKILFDLQTEFRYV